MRGTLERNEYAVYEVSAAPIHAADECFLAVRQELQEALQEGLILIERQQMIFTRDRRDFSVYRFGNNQAFTLLPSQP